MNKTLAIMAAGVGSRYGGLKQLDTIDKEGHSIIDFSIYDAIKTGFNHIIFIIRKELLEDFKKRFSHIETDQIKISYAFQEPSDVLDGFKKISRHKPWGTGHALLSLRHVVKTNFAIINADDFYGRNAFRVIHNNLFCDKKDNEYYMIGYQLKHTLSPHGTVSRGECFVSNDNYLKTIKERTGIKKINESIACLNSESIDENTIVSMNFWGFSASIFQYGKTLFKEFLNKNHDDSNSEFYIPTIVNTLIQDQTVLVKVLNTDAIWHGITYKKDKKLLESAITTLKDSNTYPKELWT